MPTWSEGTGLGTAYVDLRSIPYQRKDNLGDGKGLEMKNTDFPKLSSWAQLLEVRRST